MTTMQRWVSYNLDEMRGILSYVWLRLLSPSLRISAISCDLGSSSSRVVDDQMPLGPETLVQAPDRVVGRWCERSVDVRELP